MSNIKISVIISVYSDDNYLQKCLDSIIAQTLSNIEIFCINDGIADESLAILNKYAVNDDRITIIQHQNNGIASARNNGLRHANGKYLLFIDQNDFFEPTMLEEAYACIECYKADVIVFNSDQYYENTDEYKEASWAIHYTEMPSYQPFNRRALTDNVFKVFADWAGDKLFNHQFILDHDLWFQEQQTANDMLFVFSAIALAKRIGYVEQDHILAHQRHSTQNSLSKIREQSWDCFYKALIELRDRLQAEGIYQELEKDFINYALYEVLLIINTLNEPVRSKFIKRLKDQWIDELGISSKKMEYFYDNHEYLQYANILYE